MARAPDRRIFLDTNILLDVLLEREAFYYDALKIWSACEQGYAQGFISALSVNNVYYVVRRLKSEATAMVAVRILLRIFTVVPLDAQVLMLASDCHDRDYEDDVQLQSAISRNCLELYTRDRTHYHTRALSVLPPSAFALNRGSRQ